MEASEKIETVILKLMDHVYEPSRITGEHVKSAATAWNIHYLEKTMMTPTDVDVDQGNRYEEYRIQKYELKKAWMKSKTKADLMAWLQLEPLDKVDKCCGAAAVASPAISS